MLSRAALALVAGLIGTTAAPAQLVTYSASGLSGVSTSLPPTSTAAGLTATDVTRVGVTPVSASGGFNSSAWPTAAAPDAGKYLTFTLDPNGSPLTITQVAISDLRSGTGPTTGVLRSSADGFAADLGSPFAIGTAASTATIPVTGIVNETDPVEFRIYAYSAGASGGTFRLTNAGSQPAVVVDRTFTPVPEPATVLGAAGLGLAVAGAVRRTRRVVGRVRVPAAE